jgi:cytochrome c-type biogenesis protein CcmH
MSRRRCALLLSFALVLCAAQSPAAQSPAAQSPAEPAPGLDDHGQLQNPVLQSRFERITKELRCLVCQNESIADSNVDLAADLRRQVREMLVAGRTDDAIFEFMTDRYGEFVRFAPPLSPKTALIWGAPFFMLLLGGAIVYRVVRQRSRMPLDE